MPSTLLPTVLDLQYLLVSRDGVIVLEHSSEILDKLPCFYVRRLPEPGTMTQRVALVFGASGVSGWAMTRELLLYPSQKTFTRIIALSNRPLSHDVFLLDDPRLELVSGIDLTQPVDVVVRLLREKNRNIEQVTHVYWYAYVHAPKDGSIAEVNCTLLDTSLHALKETSPNMAHFIWQTGGKYYGAHLTREVIIPPAPWKEDAPRLPEPFASTIFYYKQTDIIKEHAKSSSWRWNDVRPEHVIGYGPATNAMNLALILGLYLSLYRAVHGIGAQIMLPASIAGANAISGESPADHLARSAIWLSLREDGALSGRSFNVAVPPSTYADRWIDLAAAWGLEGIATGQEDSDPTRAGAEVAKWIGEHASAWYALEREHGLHPGLLGMMDFGFLFAISIPVDRYHDCSAIKEAGWTEESQAAATYYREAWRRFAEAKILPPM
ncbi:hypothetical protein K488DRAFT_89633 [Vararia minispora EC-137]|uniref:Uncharacterized protein n=1 Tax=Vararia minispora EC-137 TaxID=1314806 RepID=A0ACB8Q9Z5_9AGAM|nr:hypothetical protein K488DRAFT_89633 [Vararia minispora EC-137]